MCFGNSYQESTELESSRGVRESYESKPAGLCGGCFNDEEAVAASRSRRHPHHQLHQRYGVGPRGYYPAHYYAAPLGMARPVPPRGVYFGGIGSGGNGYVAGGRVALPPPAVIVSGFPVFLSLHQLLLYPPHHTAASTIRAITSSCSPIAHPTSCGLDHLSFVNTSFARTTLTLTFTFT